MNINPLFPNPELQPLGGLAKAETALGGGEGFADVLKTAIRDVNQLQQDSDQKIGSLLKGESQDLHGTVLAVQQADTSFKMMMQVRNKIVEAYKEISRTGM